MRSDKTKIAIAAVVAAFLSFVASYFLRPIISDFTKDGDGTYRRVDATEFFASIRPFLDTRASRSEKKKFEGMVGKAFTHAMEYYVEEPHETALFEGAINRVEALNLVRGRETPERLAEVVIDGMLGSLDPDSRFVPRESLAEIKLPRPKAIGGLGMELTMPGGRVQIVSTLDQTPAERAGLKSGDVITHSDGRPVRDLSLRNVVGRLRGEVGTNVRLSIERQGVDAFEVNLTRELIQIEPVRSSVEGSTGYVRVVAFDDETHDRLGPAIESVRTQLGNDLNGLVLDLRNNPGGLREQAVAVADDFLNQGLILTVRGRRPDDVERFEAEIGELADKVPMVVLVNEGTASAAEVVASALQHHGRAVLMGRRSFGKGTQQSIIPLPDESAIRLTTSRFYAPSGRSIESEGVLPDVFIVGDRPSGEMAASDDARARSQPAIHKDRCPPVGERRDRVLGCAIALLEAGGLGAFLARYSP